MSTSRYIKYKKELVIGDDFEMPIQLQSGTPGNYTNIDITGYTIHFLLAPNLLKATTPSIQDDVTTHVSPTQGLTTGHFTSAETAVLTAGSYYLIIKWTSVTSYKKTKLIATIDVVENGKVV